MIDSTDLIYGKTATQLSLLAASEEKKEKKRKCTELVHSVRSPMNNKVGWNDGRPSTGSTTGSINDVSA